MGEAKAHLHDGEGEGEKGDDEAPVRVRDVVVLIVLDYRKWILVVRRCSTQELEICRLTQNCIYKFRQKKFEVKCQSRANVK